MGSTNDEQDAKSGRTTVVLCGDHVRIVVMRWAVLLIIALAQAYRRLVIQVEPWRRGRGCLLPFGLPVMGENVVLPSKTIDGNRCVALVWHVSEVECESRSDVAYV